ncbi:unnamed protein product [Caenorhabditis angaria]|uniref:Uncharacterized protein n=1 Tax=Caenorhabditis angaria TaxID=860376 RepID=A0A9P1J2Z1_9PELO|nr:unnamed protein product [Caenorhabditis angaria]
MATRYKIDFKNGHPMNVKAYVGTTGCSTSFQFMYRALGGFAELSNILENRFNSLVKDAGKKERVFGKYAIHCQLSYESKIQIQTDRDLLYALNIHGLDQCFTRSPFIITINFEEECDTIYLGTALEQLIMGTVSAENIIGCWGNHPVHLLLPDSRAAIPLDIDAIFAKLNAENAAEEKKSE